jgi:protein-tyrosine-phosphatase
VLDMPSNLLAHHLKVLENKRILTRSRSEGDGRRTYLRLIPGALDDMLPTGLGTARRVVFVCSQASARSVLASALWRQVSDIPASAAGIHPAHQINPRAIAAAKRHGLAIRRLRPQHLDDILERDDYIITVCDNAHEELAELPALHWSVPDPVRSGTDEAFDLAINELSRRVTDLAPRLAASRA